MIKIWIKDRQGTIRQAAGPEEALALSGKHLYALISETQTGQCAAAGDVCPWLKEAGDLSYSKGNLPELLRVLADFEQSESRPEPEDEAAEEPKKTLSIHPVTKRLERAINFNFPDFPWSLPCLIDEKGLADLNPAKKREMDGRIVDINGGGFYAHLFGRKWNDPLRWYDRLIFSLPVILMIVAVAIIARSFYVHFYLPR